MDPQAAWDRLLEAYADNDWPEVEDVASGLLDWLDANGFPPRTSPDHNVGADWNRAIAHFACQFALNQAQKGGHR